MSLTAKDIEEITRLLENSSFDELDLEIGGMKIHLRRSGVGGTGKGLPGENGDIPRFLAKGDGPPEARPLLPGEPAKRGMSPFSPGNPFPVPHAAVRAPLLGTFYRAPKPGAPPFVEVGAAVEPESIIGIIEVMKLMNTVRAGVRGVVTEICARDGALVEFDEVLLNVDARQAG